MSTNATATATPTATTYDGLYLRPNLSSKGREPSAGPYGLCPDVIGSPTPVDDPQSTFSTIDSWATMYATEPVPGERTYYYVRGMDGSLDAVAGTMSLYWAPAQLVMFPSAWKVNELAPTDAPKVSFEAASGHVGVGDVPFVWARPPVLDDPHEYVAFVAMASDSDAAPVPPSVTSWLDMSALVTKRLDIGLRNTSYVDRAAERWTRRVRFDVPATMPAGAELTITVTARGYDGASVGLIADVFAANQKAMMISPLKIVGNEMVAGIKIKAEPGLETSFALQLWKGTARPAAGATLTLAADYVVPASEAAEAGDRALVDATRSRFLMGTFGIGPTATAPLGAAVFIAD